MHPLTPEAMGTLTAALRDESIDVRSLAPEALQNAQEAKQAGAAELKRERQILAQQSKPNSYPKRTIKR